MAQDNITTLYNALKTQGIEDLGKDEQEFRTKVSTRENADKLYGYLKEQDLFEDLGDTSDDFWGKIAPKQEVQPQQTVTATEVKPQPKPQPQQPVATPAPGEDKSGFMQTATNWLNANFRSMSAEQKATYDRQGAAMGAIAMQTLAPKTQTTVDKQKQEKQTQDAYNWLKDQWGRFSANATSENIPANIPDYETFKSMMSDQNFVNDINEYTKLYNDSVKAEQNYAGGKILDPSSISDRDKATALTGRYGTRYLYKDNKVVGRIYRLHEGDDYHWIDEHGNIVETSAESRRETADRYMSNPQNMKMLDDLFLQGGNDAIVDYLSKQPDIIWSDAKKGKDGYRSANMEAMLQSWYNKSTVLTDMFDNAIKKADEEVERVTQENVAKAQQASAGTPAHASGFVQMGVYGNANRQADIKRKQCEESWKQLVANNPALSKASKEQLAIYKAEYEQRYAQHLIEQQYSANQVSYILHGLDDNILLKSARHAMMTDYERGIEQIAKATDPNATTGAEILRGGLTFASEGGLYKAAGAVVGKMVAPVSETLMRGIGNWKWMRSLGMVPKNTMIYDDLVMSLRNAGRKAEEAKKIAMPLLSSQIENYNIWRTTQGIMSGISMGGTFGGAELFKGTLDAASGGAGVVDPNSPYYTEDIEKLGQTKSAGESIMHGIEEGVHSAVGGFFGGGMKMVPLQLMGKSNNAWVRGLAAPLGFGAEVTGMTIPDARQAIEQGNYGQTWLQTFLNLGLFHLPGVAKMAGTRRWTDADVSNEVVMENARRENAGMERMTADEERNFKMRYIDPETGRYNVGVALNRDGNAVQTIYNNIRRNMLEKQNAVNWNNAMRWTESDRKLLSQEPELAKLLNDVYTACTDVRKARVEGADRVKINKLLKKVGEISQQHDMYPETFINKLIYRIDGNMYAASPVTNITYEDTAEGTMMLATDEAGRVIDRQTFKSSEEAEEYARQYQQQLDVAELNKTAGKLTLNELSDHYAEWLDEFENEGKQLDQTKSGDDLTELEVAKVQYSKGELPQPWVLDIMLENGTITQEQYDSMNNQWGILHRAMSEKCETVQKIKEQISSDNGWIPEQIDAALGGHSLEDASQMDSKPINIGGGRWRTRMEQQMVDAYKASVKDASENLDAVPEAQPFVVDMSRKGAVKTEISSVLNGQQTASPETHKVTVENADAEKKLRESGIDITNMDELMRIAGDENYDADIRQTAQQYLNTAEAVKGITEAIDEAVESAKTAKKEELTAVESHRVGEEAGLGLTLRCETQDGRQGYIVIGHPDENVIVTIKYDGADVVELVKADQVKSDEIVETYINDEVATLEESLRNEYTQRMNAILHGGEITPGEEVVVDGKSGKVMGIAEDGSYVVDVEGKQTPMSAESIYTARDAQMSSQFDAQQTAEANRKVIEEKAEQKREEKKQLKPSDVTKPGETVILYDENGNEMLYQVMQVDNTYNKVHMTTGKGQYLTMSAEDLQARMNEATIRQSVKKGNLVDLPDGNGKMKTWEVFSVSDSNITLRSEDGQYMGMSPKDYQNAIRESMGMDKTEEATGYDIEKKAETTEKTEQQKAEEALEESYFEDELKKETEAQKRSGRDPKTGKFVAFPVDENGNTAIKREDIPELYDMLVADGEDVVKFASNEVSRIEKAIEDLANKEPEGDDINARRESAIANRAEIARLTQQRNMMRLFLDERGKRELYDKDFTGLVTNVESHYFREVAPEMADIFDKLAKKFSIKLNLKYGLTNENGLINGNNTLKGIVNVNFDAYVDKSISEDITPDQKRRTALDYLNAVMGHEVVHSLFKNDKAAMSEFMNLTKKYLGDRYNEIRAEKLKKPEYNEDNVDEEICCDMAGQLMSDKAFLKRLLEEPAKDTEGTQPRPVEERLSMLDKVHKAVGDFFNKVRGINEAMPETKEDVVPTVMEEMQTELEKQFRESQDAIREQHQKDMEAAANRLKAEAERMKREAEERDKRMKAAQVRYDKMINDARKEFEGDDQALSVLDDREPQTLEEAISLYLPARSLFLKDYVDGAGRKVMGLEGELGLKYADLNRLNHYIGKRENGAKTINQVAEEMWSDFPENIKQQYGQMDVANALRDMLMTARSVDDIRHMIDINRIDTAREIYNRNLADEEAYYQNMREGETGTMLSVRTKPDPKKTVPCYKLMRLEDDGKLYPLFIDAAAPTELGVWYDADAPDLEWMKPLASGTWLVDPKTKEAVSYDEFYAQHPELFKGKQTKYPTVEAVNWATKNGYRFMNIEDTQRAQKRFDGETRKYWNLGINGSGTVSTFSMRPGWHAGSLPTMRQIGKGKNKDLRDDKFVWVEGELSADKDYNAEVQQNPDKDMPDRIPEDGFYLKATNADKAKSQSDVVGWYVAGAFKPNRIMSDSEARAVIDKWNAEHPEAQAEYDYERESGKVFNAKTMQLEDKAMYSARQEVERKEANVDDEQYKDVAKTEDGTFVGSIDKQTGDIALNIAPEETAYSIRQETDKQITWRKKQYSNEELRNKFIDSSKMTDEQKEAVKKIMKDAVALAEKQGATSKQMEIWNNSMVTLDEKGKPVFTVVIPDAEYPMNFGISLVCKRRRALDAVMGEISRSGLINQLASDPMNIVAINQIIKDHGLEVACDLCYVEARRFRSIPNADKFTSSWNQMIESLDPSNKYGRRHHNFGENKQLRASDVLVNEGIEDADNANLDFSYIDSVIADYKAYQKMSAKDQEQYKKDGRPGAILAKQAQFIKDHPEVRKLLDRSDFADSEGFSNAHKRNDAILSLFNSTFGASNPKNSFGDRPYNGDFLTRAWKVNKAFHLGGVRFQSFDDYIGKNWFDYLAAHADLMTKGMPAHSYSKEELYVKSFGLTGNKINMSMVPDAIGDYPAGLDANGNYLWHEGYDIEVDRDGKKKIVRTDKQTFGWDDARAIRKAPGYRDNCGTIAVGVSDAHIWKMMFDPEIDMIIPYHSSSLNRTIAHAMGGVGKFTDYTASQIEHYATGEKAGNGLSKKDAGRVPNINKLMADKAHGGSGMDARQAVEFYVRWCEENGIQPKFEQFLYKREGDRLDGKILTDENGNKMINDGYYKFLADFKILAQDDAGNEYFVPQKAVGLNMPKEGDTFGSFAELTQRGVDEWQEIYNDIDSEMPSIVKDIKDKIINGDLVTKKYAEAQASMDKWGIKYSKADVTPKAKPEGKLSTRSENFKKWFGDSKVTDEKGEPLTVYHGSPRAGFTEFSTKDGAIWLSSAKSHAERYGKFKESKDNLYENNTYPLYATIKNPIEVGYVDAPCAENNDFYRLCETFDMSPEELMNKCDVWEYKNALAYEEYVQHAEHEDAVDGALLSTPLYALTRSKGFMELAKEKGYDGISAVEFNKADNTRVNTFAAFDPTQIKSATENNGEYDGSNPDIRYSTRKEQQAEVIRNSNPKDESLSDHTWIENADDIKTFSEAVKDEWIGTPDFTLVDAAKALKTGKVTVYSSYPIENGVFVTPSKMEAESYAGDGKVYSKEMNLDDVAWIDSNEGQVAVVKKVFNRAIPTLANAIKTIKRLFAKSLKPNGTLERQVIAGTDKRQQNDLNQKGINVDENWVHSIDDAHIAHAMKQHGNEAVERSRGQIAITESDFEKIPDILRNYDNLDVSSNTNKQRNNVVIYNKKYPDGTTYYVEEVRNGRKSLAFQTMYKKGSSGGVSVDSSPYTSLTAPDSSLSADKGTNNSANTQGNEAKSESGNIKNSVRYAVRTPNGMDADEARRVVTEQIKHLMSDKNIDAMQKKDLNKMLNQIRFATPENIFERVQDVQRTVRGIETRVLGSQLNDLLKLKMQDVNGKNQSIAKTVDNQTRMVMDKIRDKMYGVTTTDADQSLTQKRSEMWHLREDNKQISRELQASEERGFPYAMNSPEYMEAAQKIHDNEARMEALRGEIEGLQQLRDETVAKQRHFEGKAIDKAYDELMEKMADAADPDADVTWTEEDNANITALEILKDRFEIEDMYQNIKEKRKELSQATRKLQREMLQTELDQMEKERYDATKNLVEKVQGVVEGGKTSLAAQKQALMDHKRKIVSGVIGDIAGKKASFDPHEEEGKKKGNIRSWVDKVVKGTMSPLKSFAYMCEDLDRNHMAGDGFLTQYFLKGKGGVMEANNAYLRGFKEAGDTLNKKTEEIFGKNIVETAQEGKKTSREHGITIFVEETDADGNVINTYRKPLVYKDNTEPMPLSKNEATYLYMVWQMPDGRVKMLNEGFDETSIDEIKQYIGNERIQWADYVQQEYLPSLFPKYNKKYMELHGTPMKQNENYVPLRYDTTAMRTGQEELLTNGGQTTTNILGKNGFTINRTQNMLPVSKTTDCFDVIMDHVREGEEFTAYADVRRDLDAVLASKAVKMLMNRNSQGSFDDFKEACKVATKTYGNDAKAVDKFFNSMTKGLVGANIAFRIGTAIKQTTSVPAFLAYTTDKMFLADFGKNLVKGYGGNILGIIGGSVAKETLVERMDAGKWSGFTKDFKWAMDNIPSFRNRISVGDMGNEILNMDHNTFRAKVMQHGMYANQMVDATTCLVGIKAVYDYNMRKATKEINKLYDEGRITAEERDKRLEEAHRTACMEADVCYNSSQQSSNEAFLSPTQASNAFFYKALMAYKNSPISYARHAILAVKDLGRVAANYNKMVDTYANTFEMAGMTQDEALKAAKARVGKRAWEAMNRLSMYTLVLGGLWQVAGKGVFGFWMSDEQKEELWTLGNILKTASGGGVPLYDMFAGEVNGDGYEVMLLSGELAQIKNDVERLNKEIAEDPYWGKYDAMLTAMQKVSRLYGVDLETVGNVFLGIEEMIRQGMSEEEIDVRLNTEFLLNIAKSNRKASTLKMYIDEDTPALAEEVAKASKLFTTDDFRRYVPGTKTLDDKAGTKILNTINNVKKGKALKEQAEREELLKSLNTREKLEEAFDNTSDMELRDEITKKLKEIEKNKSFGQKSWKQRTDDYMSKKDEKEEIVDDTDGSKTFKKYASFEDVAGELEMNKAVDKFNKMRSRLKKLEKADYSLADDYYNANQKALDFYDDELADLIKDYKDYKKELVDSDEKQRKNILSQMSFLRQGIVDKIKAFNEDK